MKKSIFYDVALLAIAGIMITGSCKKETEPDMITNNNTTVNEAPKIPEVINYELDTSVRLNYTVMLVSGNHYSIGMGKSADNLVAGATVSISQAGSTQQKQTDANGYAVFTGFFKGVLSVSITKDDYTGVKYLVTANSSFNTVHARQIEVANIIPVFKTKNDPATATLTGRVTYQNDLTNLVRETVPQNTKIVANIDASDATFRDTYLKITNPYILDSLQSGKILQYAYEATFYSVTNASGNYSIEIPASTAGLPFKISAPDLAADQKYFENSGVSGFNQLKTSRTIFSATQVPSPVPAAGGADVAFTAGSGAAAFATISGNGQIERINITNGGNNYVAVPNVAITGGGGNGATATAIISNGVVTGINVTNAGNGYTSAPAITLNAGSGALFAAAIGGTGTVTSIAVTNSGSGYTSVPTVVISAPATGTTATATANLTNGRVSSITITDAGSGYTSAPTITIGAAPTGGVNATAITAFSGLSVQNITLISPGTSYTGTPTVTFSDPQLTGGQRATAVANFDPNTGSITSLTLTNAGRGYTSAPSIAVSAGSGATAEAVFSGRILTGITITSQGADYTSAPKVKITGGGGSGAAATAILSNGRVTGFTITNAGSGYLAAPSIELVSGSGAQAYVTVTNGQISAVNLVNGGSGYTGAPKVSINPVPGGPGAGATATATVDVTTGAVTGITINTPGTGYIGGNVPSIAESFSVTPADVGGTISVKPGGVYIRDIHLGTGFRLPD